MNIKKLFPPELVATECAKLTWSVIPALLVGYGLHNAKVGFGILLIMFFVTSVGEKIDEIYKRINK